MSGLGSPAPTVGSLAPAEFTRRVEQGLGLAIGPFTARIRVRHDAITDALYKLYSDYPLVAEGSVFSFHAWLDRRRPLLPWRGQRVRFTVDGRVPHEDMPASHGLAVLEWGINLVIALRFHSYLMLHSAVVARDDRALLLPAAPGAGKTTLCAALALRGWRLFSDEFGMLRPGTSDMIPLPRPMALKNESIDVIRHFSADAELGPAIAGTRKGTVAHLQPPTDSARRAAETASARWIVYPRWQAGSECRLEELAPADSFMLLATNAFNYEVLGEAGFTTVKGLVDRCRSYRLIYSDLDQAIEALERMADQDEA
ncbi:HprK-related kinase A [Lentisalinibacter orientalis]|uniref:HprK-related kinase A n=1 Tax=Lentisalinibacter orientalis TaxID=2992241 RepID=UPI00386A212E